MYPFPLTPPEDQLSHPYELAFSKHDLSIVSEPPVASLTVIPVTIVSRSPILQMTLVVPTERVVFLVTPSSHWHAELSRYPFVLSEYVAEILKPAGLNFSPSLYTVFAGVPLTSIAVTLLTVICAVHLIDGLSVLWQVMVVVPFATAVTLPVASMVATLGFEEVQVKLRFAFAGAIVALSEISCPTESVVVAGESEMLSISAPPVVYVSYFAATACKREL